IARRLNQPAHVKTFGRALALHWARSGDGDALIAHLESCQGLGMLDRDLLGEVEREVADHRGVRDDPSWLLCLSCCHEHFGDLNEPRRWGPPALGDRRIRLIETLEQAALAAAARGESNHAMAALMALRKVLADEAAPGPAWLERRGILERHRAELLRVGRK